jgi:hypothetical protein
MRLPIAFSCLAIAALLTPAHGQGASPALTKTCKGEPDAEKRLVCLEERIDALEAILSSGFQLKSVGNTTDSRCIGLQTNTTHSPILLPCESANNLKHWIVERAK